MSSNSRIPQLLAQYIQDLPKDSLILNTSTLSNSVNWLIVRYLCSAFSNDAVKARSSVPQVLGEPTHDTTTDVGVVLVSWMRSWEFWKTEARRAGGLDLALLSQNARLAFVNGIVAASDQAQSTPSGRPTVSSERQAPVANSVGAARNPTPTTLRSPANDLSSNLPKPAMSSSRAHTIASPNISRVRDGIDKALSSLKTESALLIIDGLDVLLPLQNPHTSSSSSATSAAILSLLMSLRLHPRVNSTILSLQSDINPLRPAMPDQHIPSPLEVESKALLVGVAHAADLVISVRGLDTGAAGDVGGVLRVTKGTPRDEETNTWKEQELLYLVKPDGSAKVWERGAGVGVG